MDLLKPCCEYKYYEHYDDSKLLNEIQQNISTSIASLDKEYAYVFHRMMNTRPCIFWNKDVYTQTVSLLEKLFQDHPSELKIEADTYNYFLMGYDAYCQLCDTILDISGFNIEQEIKTRLYRLPTYSTILESCLSNFLSLIAVITGQGVGKDYTTQNKLGQLIPVLESNGYTEISQRINVNIRNAINHGKVLMRKNPSDQICFYYVENRIQKCQEMAIYEFDNMIDNSLDVVSAVLLAIITFLNNHKQLIQTDLTQKDYVSFARLSMSLSIPGIYCSTISNTDNLKQINVEIDIDKTERSYIAQIATLMAVLVYDRYNDYEQYMFSFNHPRMLNGWVRYKKEDLTALFAGTGTFDSVVKAAMDRKDFLIFDPSTEDVDLNEVKYFCFPNYSSELYQINNVQDASVEDRKRLRAALYIGDVEDREKILAIIGEALEWLKTLKNPASPQVAKKHGSMPADAIYLNVYRHDARKNKGLNTKNENFVCFVDYNISGETTLMNGSLPKVIWDSFHHEKVDNMFIAWREAKYITRRVDKVGRNDPCPCGSGKKYKKCCGSNI